MRLHRPLRAACAALSLSIALVMPPAGSAAQDDPASTDALVPLWGRHAITLNAGLLSRSSTLTEAFPFVRTDTRATGFLGSVSYAYWLQPEWTVGASAGALNVETATFTGPTGVTSESAVVAPILFAVAYYPDALATSPSTRLWFSAAAGPYVGSATNTNTGLTVGTRTVTETAMGLRVLAGWDFFFGRWFKGDIAAGYHFVEEFDEPIGSDTRYSGPEASLGFGVLLGQGR